ncbi:MAG: hypothetical protein V1898_04760 [Patescibacteria group bacterium]
MNLIAYQEATFALRGLIEKELLSKLRSARGLDQFEKQVIPWDGQIADFFVAFAENMGQGGLDRFTAKHHESVANYQVVLDSYGDMPDHLKEIRLLHAFDTKVLDKIRSKNDPDLTRVFEQKMAVFGILVQTIREIYPKEDLWMVSRYDPPDEIFKLRQSNSPDYDVISERRRSLRLNMAQKMSAKLKDFVATMSRRDDGTIDKGTIKQNAEQVLNDLHDAVEITGFGIDEVIEQVETDFKHEFESSKRVEIRKIFNERVKQQLDAEYNGEKGSAISATDEPTAPGRGKML